MRFALDVIQLVEALPQTGAAGVVGRQLLRAGTSVGANYRAACRAKSAADFRAKMAIVEEEADEAAYWMEIPCEAGIVGEAQIRPLLREANDMLAIAVASIKTSRLRG